jgi:hypothetical protein
VQTVAAILMVVAAEATERIRTALACVSDYGTP